MNGGQRQSGVVKIQSGLERRPGDRGLRGHPVTQTGCVALHCSEAGPAVAVTVCHGENTFSQLSVRMCMLMNFTCSKCCLLLWHNTQTGTGKIYKWKLHSLITMISKSHRIKKYTLIVLLFL